MNHCTRLSSTDPGADPPLPTGVPPDWNPPRDVNCPTCQFNLRMLRTPRCPECGLTFRWQALLDVACPRCAEPLGTVDGDNCPSCALTLNGPRLFDGASLLDRRYFEYSDHPLRAAFRTWVAALNPWRFWAGVPLESPPAENRLRRLRVVAIGVCLIGLLLVAALNPTAVGWKAGAGQRAYALGRAFGFTLLPTFMLPLLTTLALPRFTPTLVRFHIRRDQLLRCMCYATSGLFWIGVAFGAAFGLALLSNSISSPSSALPVWLDPDFLLNHRAQSRGACNLL